MQPLIEEGMWEDVMVTSVEAPDDFYCKLVSSEDEFNCMSEEIESYCNSLRPGNCCIISTYCMRFAVKCTFLDTFVYL